MIPISLKIKGVYSYQEEQQIDFSDLTSAGLFGIFGAVGSGKSAILESITLALYGENDRLGSKDNRWYNILNLKSAEGFIEFIFDYANSRYKFELILKRNSKNFDDVKLKSKGSYIWKNNDWIPLEGGATSLLGLSYDNFKRTIIIPQGKFRDFFELGPSDRRKMVQEVFNLDRFDVALKVSERYNAVLAEKLLLEGELKSYEGITKVQLKELKEQLDALSANSNTISEAYDTQTHKLETLRITKSKWEERLTLQKQLEQLQSERSVFDKRKQQLETYITIYQSFKGLIDNLEQQQKETATTAKEIAQLTEVATTKQNERKALQEQLTPIQTSYNRLEEKRKQVADFETAAKIIDCQQQINELKVRQTNGSQIVADKEKQVNEIKTQLSAVRQNIKGIAEQVLNTALIHTIDTWILQQTNQQKEIQKLQEKLSGLQEKQERIINEFETEQLQITSFHTYYEEKLTLLKQQLQEQQNTLQIKLIEDSFLGHAHSLQEGTPCPLCGATEHPAPIQNNPEIKHQITTLKASIATQQQTISQTEQAYTAAKDQYLLYKNLQQQTDETQQELIVAAGKLKQLEAQTTFEHYTLESISAFLQEKEAFFKADQAKSEYLKKEQALQTVLENHQNDLKKYEDAITSFNVQIAGIKATEQTHFANIHSIDANYYIKEGKEALEQQKRIVLDQIKTTEATFETLQAQVQNTDSQLSNLDGKLQTLQATLAKNKLYASQLEETLTQKLATATVKTQEEVTSVLAWDLDIQKEQEDIGHFYKATDALQSNILLLDEQLKGLQYKEGTLEEQQDIVAVLKQKRDAALSDTAALKEKTTALAHQLQEKQSKTAAFEKTDRLYQHLSTIRNLLKGNKFVEFVSVAYLQQLCHRANERFHRLTRNQLSLQLNDKYEFEVIDYLNGGKPRSIKTLSGGQIFQASLCMALALAENVQSKTKQDKNFFFIDEGFGTLDKSALDIVFDTLQALRKEDRIVGVISHVEEMQENIAKYLTVQKDAFTGSHIYQV